MLLTSGPVLLVVSLDNQTIICGTDAASVRQDEKDNITAACYYIQCAYQVPENNMAMPFNAAIICKNYISRLLPLESLLLNSRLTDCQYQVNLLADCFACASLQNYSSTNAQERRTWQGACDDYVKQAPWHLGLDQLQSSRPLELMWSALHWSPLAVREANEYAREFGVNSVTREQLIR